MESTAAMKSRVVHPARDGERPLTAEDLWTFARPGRPIASPDGARLAVPVAEPDVEKNRLVTRIHLMDADGSNARPVTAAERHATTPAFSPDGTRMAFCARPADDAKAPMQVYVLPLSGGEAERKTDLPLGAFDPTWMPDGSGLVFGVFLYDGHLTIADTREEHERREEEPIKWHATEDRMFRFWDRWLTHGKRAHLFHLDLATGDLTDLTPTSTYWWPWMDPNGAYDLAPDGSEIAFIGLHIGGPHNRLRADLFRVPTDGSGTLTCFTEAHNSSSHRPRYAPDGTWLVYSRTEDPDFYADRGRLMRLDLSTNTATSILEDWDRAPGAWVFASDGSIVLHAEDDGSGRLFHFTPGDDAPTVLGEAGGWYGQPEVASDGAIYFIRQSLAHPQEVWKLDGDGARGLTTFNRDAVDGIALGEVRDVRFEGARGDEVQMFLVIPPGLDTSKPQPLVHMIHGGPHGLFGDFWHPRWHAQAFAAPGYITACVNFHGSTSFGQEFAQCIQGAWGDYPSQDIHRATDLLIEQGLVDPERIAVSGGSYGGYLTSWLASTSDRFTCAVNHAGVYDLTLQYASDVTYGRPRNMGAQIWDDPEQVDRWNPARHSAGLNTPMLVIHGERDFRVPVNHAHLCYGILQARGIPSRLVYFEDENHWILKPKNSIRWSNEVMGWFERYIGGGKA